MAKVPRSADLLVDFLLAKPGILTPDAAGQEEALRELARKATRHLPPPAKDFDPWIYRLVVVFLGVVTVSSAFGAIYLSATTSGTAAVDIPDALTALGSAAIGALAGLLAPSPSSRTLVTPEP